MAESEKKSTNSNYKILIVVGVVIAVLLFVLIIIFVAHNNSNSTGSVINSQNNSNNLQNASNPSTPILGNSGFLTELQQSEEYPYFVPSMITKDCNLIISNLNVDLTKDDTTYRGNLTISGELTNTNSVPLFDIILGYGLYSKTGSFLTYGNPSKVIFSNGTIIDVYGISLIDKLSPNETIQFSGTEEGDYQSYMENSPGIIYNSYAYKISVQGQKPDLSFQDCPYTVGYVAAK